MEKDTYRFQQPAIRSGIMTLVILLLLSTITNAQTEFRDKLLNETFVTFEKPGPVKVEKLLLQLGNGAGVEFYYNDFPLYLNEVILLPKGKKTLRFYMELLSGEVGLDYQVHEKEIIIGGRTAYIILTDRKKNERKVAETKQAVYPKTSEPCPDFALQDINYYSRKSASLNDFKGKPLILDFWTRSCVSCIESFPKFNTLFKTYNDSVQFISVAVNDKLVKPLFERYKKKWDLQFPVAFEDDLYEKLGIPSFPHIIWIDQAGIVRAITDERELTNENIQAFISGKTMNLPEKLNEQAYEKQQSTYNMQQPFLVNGNGGSDTEFIQRSVLARAKEYMPWLIEGYYPDSSHYLISQVSLSKLYQAAWYDEQTRYPYPLRENSTYGEWWPDPLLLVSDSSAFIDSDYKGGRNFFTYHLSVPPEKAGFSRMQKIMRNDLNNYFGFEVSVELRTMPCWKLVASAEAIKKLPTKGKKHEIAGDGVSSVKLVNLPVGGSPVKPYSLLAIIWGLHQKEPPFIDATGITSNIDISLEGALTDLNELKKSLNKNGLDLIKGERQMKVIVIRDPKINESQQ